MKKVFKQVVVTGLTLAMVVGGSTAAFADGKGKGNDKDRGRDWDKDVKIDYRSNANVKINNLKIGNVNFIFNFSDVVGGDVEWALKHIASLANKRVFEGFEDGTFRPRETIRRVDAIAATVRLLGLEEQAKSPAKMNAELNFKDADKVKEKFPWAVGYIAVALENDLFSEDEVMIEPEKPMNRLDATVLLVKAKKWDAEARAKNTVKLPFKDENQIPAGSVGYVAVAVEKGLIQGFEDNTFRPNQPVTRAQMAALFDRVGDYLPDHDKYMVSGTVQAINNNVLTINKNGTTTQVAINPNASVWRNNAFTTLSSIQVGDQVKVSLFNNTGIFVEVTGTSSIPTNPVPGYEYTVDGKLASFKVGDNSKITEISVTTQVYGSNGNTTELKTFSVDPNYTLTPSGAQLYNHYDKNVQLKVRIQAVNNQAPTQVVTAIELKN